MRIRNNVHHRLFCSHQSPESLQPGNLSSPCFWTRYRSMETSYPVPDFIINWASCNPDIPVFIPKRIARVSDEMIGKSLLFSRHLCRSSIIQCIDPRTTILEVSSAPQNILPSWKTFHIPSTLVLFRFRDWSVLIVSSKAFQFSLRHKSQNQLHCEGFIEQSYTMPAPSHIDQAVLSVVQLLLVVQ